MNRKQIDRMYDGVKLSDSQLSHVPGGLNLPLQQVVKTAPQLKANMYNAVRPIFNKH